MFHQAETDRFLDYPPSSSIVYGFRPLSENMLRLKPLASTIDQWVNIHPQTEVARSMDVNGCVLSGIYQSSTSNKRFSDPIKHNQSNLKTFVWGPKILI
jgi:hypothetical protein